MTADICQEKEPPQKPRDRIEDEMQASLRASFRAIFSAVAPELTEAEVNTYLELNGQEPSLQIAGLSCYVAAIKGELDREAERRAKWEETVEVRLNGLITRFAADPL